MRRSLLSIRKVNREIKYQEVNGKINNLEVYSKDSFGNTL
jgi:hypothetical protein